jgi:cytochrome c-type biogenesis protein CcmH
MDRFEDVWQPASEPASGVASGWALSKTLPVSACRGVLAIFVAMTVFTSVAHAVTPDEVLKDPALEGRARAISQLLRCVVCQNQSIDDSNAPLAHDLRVILRERLVSGDTDEQAVDFIVGRYGNFILLKPPMQLNTLALWAGPALLVLIATLVFGWYLHRRTSEQATEIPAGLTAIEQERIAELLSRRSLT